MSRSRDEAVDAMLAREEARDTLRVPSTDAVLALEEGRIAEGVIGLAVTAAADCLLPGVVLLCSGTSPRAEYGADVVDILRLAGIGGTLGISGVCDRGSLRAAGVGVFGPAPIPARRERLGPIAPPGV